MRSFIAGKIGTAPEKAIQEVRTLIQETKAGFLVVDVLQKFCRIKDLNDYAQVTNTLEPLMAIAREENCHILLTHHAGKADRQDGDDILGSTALLGGVDTLISNQEAREPAKLLHDPTIRRRYTGCPLGRGSFGKRTPNRKRDLGPGAEET